MIEGGPLTGPLPLFSIKNIILFKKEKQKNKKYTLLNKMVSFVEKKVSGLVKRPLYHLSFGTKC
jgi:hypothetical protein